MSELLKATFYLLLCSGSGADYARVRDAQSPLARAVMENYRVWHPRFGAGGPLAATNSCKPMLSRRPICA